MAGARLIFERYSSFLLLPTPADAAPASSSVHPLTSSNSRPSYRANPALVD